MTNNLHADDRDLVMRFTSNAYNDIINTIGRIPAESGGLLFGHLDDYVVREFIFDEAAYTTCASYTINTDFVNKHVRRLWDEKALACIGFIHSHPFGLKVPSIMDVRYFQRAFKWMPRPKLLVPIVSTIPDGGYNLNPCILFNGDKDITVGTHIEIVVEPHVSKYGYIINPPKVQTITPTSVPGETVNTLPPAGMMEGGDYVDVTGWDSKSWKESSKPKTSIKESLNNFLNYLLDGLFPYK